MTYRVGVERRLIGSNARQVGRHALRIDSKWYAARSRDESTGGSKALIVQHVVLAGANRLSANGIRVDGTAGVAAAIRVGVRSGASSWRRWSARRWATNANCCQG